MLMLIQDLLTFIYAVTLKCGEDTKQRNASKNRVVQVTKLQIKTDQGRSSTTITYLKRLFRAVSSLNYFNIRSIDVLPNAELSVQ